MASLQYRGAPAAANADLAYKGYVGLLKTADLSVAQIDSAITSGLAGYATVAYVDSKDVFNVTKAYIDQQDNARIKLSQKGIANGVVALDSTGRVSPNRINAPLTQKWVRGPWTPATYHGAPVNVTATETTLFTCPVTDPGYPYKLVVFGTIDAKSSLETEYPIVNVRYGATNGEIIAQGLGQLDAPDAAAPTNGELFNIANPDGLDPDTWNQTSLSGTGGHYQVIGGQAGWVQAGATPREWRFRRLGPDATTLTDYQKVRLTIGTAIGESPVFGTPHQYVRLCARMNTAETDWVGCEITDDTFTMRYSLGGVVSTPGGAGWTVSPSASFATTQASGMTYDVLAGTSGSLKQVVFFRNNVLLGGMVDVNGITQADAAHRGWGWYAQAAGRIADQCDPPDIAEVLIADAPPSFDAVSVLPYNLHAATVRTGPATLYIRGARSGGASTQSFSPYDPRLTIFAVPA